MRYNIIIVDDVEQDVEQLASTLKAGGNFKLVFKAFDGREAIEYLQGKSPFNDRQLFPLPHIIFIDLNMLNLDGAEVIRWIREHSAPVLVLVVTSLADPQLEAQALSLGAVAVFNKPLTEADVRVILQFTDDRFIKQQSK